MASWVGNFVNLTQISLLWDLKFFLVHLSWRLKCTIVITRCPSSVRPSLTFHIFNFSSETSEQNSTKLDRKQELKHPLPSLCFLGRSEKQDGRPGLSLAETFRLLLWNRWMKFKDTWQEARTQCRLPSVCFSGWSEKQDGRPGLWLAETFSTSPLKLLNGIQQNLSGNKIGKTRWPPWPLIGWDIFDFSSETAERNSKKLDRKQDLNVFYQVCAFRANWKNKMAALASHWLRHFDFSSETAEWNSKTLDRKQELNVVYQVSVFQADRKNKMDALASDWLRHFRLSSETAEWNAKKLDRKQDLNVFYQVCVFRANWKNKMAALACDWLRHFRLFLWNRWTEIQRNLTGSKISTSSTKFVVFGQISKQKCLPWPIPQKGGTLFSGARYVALWASCCFGKIAYGSILSFCIFVNAYVIHILVDLYVMMWQLIFLMD